MDEGTDDQVDTNDSGIDHVRPQSDPDNPSEACYAWIFYLK